jgi:nucleoside 2-deoxyribosyltransferase
MLRERRIVQKIYLAGAIRNGIPADIEWREQACKRLKLNYDVLSPIAGKQYANDKWTLLGGAWTGRQIVKQDFAMIDSCDIFLANLEALNDSYPCIGTLVELGRAIAFNKLIYVIGATPIAGFDVHPFIAENAAVIFPSVSDALWYLERYVYCLNGMCPESGMQQIEERLENDTLIVKDLTEEVTSAD